MLQILFLIFGGLTVFWGAFQFVAVADSPKNAWFLTKPQREAATIRLKDASSEKANNMFRLYQTWEALRDPAIWCLIGYTMCTGICNGGLASVRFPLPPHLLLDAEWLTMDDRSSLP